MSRRLIDLTEADLDQRDERLLAAIAAELQASSSSPLLLDRTGMARALSCSVKTLDRLRAEPMFPEVPMVDSPRFDPVDVVAWLKARGPGLRVIGAASDGVSFPSAQK